MSDFLDDAVRQLPGPEAERLAEAFRQQRESDEDKFIDLVDDFLTRMAAAGNPNAWTDWPDGKRRTVKAWSLKYDDDDGGPPPLILTVDGRVPYAENVAKLDRHGRVKGYTYSGIGLRSFWEGGIHMSDQKLKRLAWSMAQLLPKDPGAPSEPESA